MTMVPFSRNGATPIFSHLLVLTFEKNHLGFVELFLEKALETKLLDALVCMFFLLQQQLLESYSNMILY